MLQQERERQALQKKGSIILAEHSNTAVQQHCLTAARRLGRSSHPWLHPHPGYGDLHLRESLCSHRVFEAFPPVLPGRSWCFPNQDSHKTSHRLAFNSYPLLQQQQKPFFELTRTVPFASSKNSKADKKNLSLISDEENKNPIFKQKALYAINHELILWSGAKKGIL